VATRVLTLAQALEAYHRTAFTESSGTAAAIESKDRVLKTVKPVLSPEDWKWLTSQLQHAGDPSLRTRLCECASRVATIIDPMIPDLVLFSKSLGKVRNTYSHFGAGGSGGEEVRRDYVLERQAYWVLVTNYLLDLGFSEEQARSLISRNQVFQHDLRPEWIDL
jgi:ApeA N-terminal domain 1